MRSLKGGGEAELSGLAKAEECSSQAGIIVEDCASTRGKIPLSAYHIVIHKGNYGSLVT